MAAGQWAWKHDTVNCERAPLDEVQAWLHVRVVIWTKRSGTERVAASGAAGRVAAGSREFDHFALATWNTSAQTPIEPPSAPAAAGSQKAPAGERHSRNSMATKLT
ncbi:hypothetical protein PUN4_840044 [Paraburkholderia unamae]|nr:hypothetical protein PUN4_840044 [Paraburkholderia unamae]